MTMQLLTCAPQVIGDPPVRPPGRPPEQLESPWAPSSLRLSIRSVEVESGGLGWIWVSISGLWSEDKCDSRVRIQLPSWR